MTLDQLRSAGILAALDFHFARTIARIGGEARPAVILAAALVSRGVSQGHVCIDLPALVRQPLWRDADGEVIAEQPWPPLAVWLDELRSSPLVGAPTGHTPLLLDAAGRLYLRRYWEHEETVARAIRQRIEAPEVLPTGSWLRAALDRLFAGNAASGEPDWQRMAALLAILRRFCVISGGPGTGKTYTVVKILALLVESALHQDREPPRILLVAPTGKAAVRLAEAIRGAKAQLAATDVVKAAIPESASTIHRCLGVLGGSATRFRHHAANPLLADVVLVDEASMVDLGLMARLVTALPAQARLILLGDQDQLASVEAGSVLGDICNTGTARMYSRRFADTVAGLCGDQLPVAAVATSLPPIADCIVQLTRSYRYGADSGIGALAKAINAGDAATAVSILDSKNIDVVRVEPQPDWALSPELRIAVVAGFEPLLRGPTAAARLDLLGHFRVLCAHRRGAAGVDSLNPQIEAALQEAGLLEVDRPLYNGRPVMVTHNDYQLGLFNGDIGVVMPDRQAADVRLVYFPAEQGSLRSLSASRLPQHETVFAMSVHKSQGSEFDEVAIVLPSKMSPVLTRELLYTAVTRARHKVTLVAAGDVVSQTIERRVERASGLRQRLWE